MDTRLLIFTTLLYLAFLSGCSDSSQKDYSVESGTVTVGDVNIFFESLGEGPPILVVHGGPGLDHGYLRPGLDPLSEAGRLIYYDQRSVGKSGDQPSPHSVNLDRALADIEALRKGLGIHKMHLVGHSWGAILAMLYAARNPDQVFSLVLMTPSPPTYSGMLQLEAMKRARRSKEDDQALSALVESEPYLLGEPEAINQFMNRWFRVYLSPSSTPDTLAFKLHPNTAKNWAQVNRFMIRQLGHYDFLPDAADIEVPTLLIQGEEDVLPTIVYQRLHRNIPNAEHVLIPNSGHFPFLEQPEVLFETVIPFIDKHSEK